MGKHIYTICTVTGCTRPHHSWGFCRLHYRRWRKGGDPMICLPPGRKPLPKTPRILVRKPCFQVRSWPTTKCSELARLLGVSRQRADQLLHPQKRWARQRLHSALERGKISPPLRCERCDGGTRLFSHHVDYSQPLLVEWLCKDCHIIADSQMRRWTDICSLKKP